MRHWQQTHQSPILEEAQDLGLICQSLIHTHLLHLGHQHLGNKEYLVVNKQLKYRQTGELMGRSDGGTDNCFCNNRFFVKLHLEHPHDGLQRQATLPAPDPV